MKLPMALFLIAAAGWAQSRTLDLDRTRYRLRAGDGISIDAPAATRAFVGQAKSSAVEFSGLLQRGFAVGVSRSGDLVLSVSPLTPPGDYTLQYRATSLAGETRSAAFTVQVESVTPVPFNSTVPPIIFLDGWQFTCPGTLSGTFGALPQLLQDPSIYPGNPSVYFFDNCAVCPECSIEALGALLGQFIGSLTHYDGSPVTQVDLVAHSMGGLIVRSYLSGKQTAPGTFTPPASTLVRKAIFIASPQFGSFQVNSPLGEFFAGTQTSEMAPGSQFLWDLATWNQNADDLRGVDAVALIGNAGEYPTAGSPWNNASDGIVSLTSGSLGFASVDQRTRIVPYCHITFTAFEIPYAGCSSPGITDSITTANYATHPTFVIVQSFLTGTSAWQSTGNPPSKDQYLSLYEGVEMTLKDASGAYVQGIGYVQYGNSAGSLSAGPAANPAADVFYNEFLPTGSISFSIGTNGPTISETAVLPAGGVQVLRFKLPPAISSVQSSLSTGLPGLTVASGSTLTIKGSGFASGDTVTAGNTTLTSQIVSSQQITATLPASVPAGLVNLAVSGAAGQDSINIFVGAVPSHPAFFAGESSVGSNLFFLKFPGGNPFGYYGYLSSSIFYHVDLGYEAFVPGTGASLYLFDFASQHWFYSSASLFPYLYDFTLNAWLYYFPDTKNAGHYTTNPRSFVNLTTGAVFTM